MTGLAENLARVRRRMNEAALRCGRDPKSVGLIAVSKFHPLDRILSARALGQRDFGENYVREAQSKIGAAAAADVAWHFVGRIQSNKARVIANRFTLIHSIDRVEVAERLNAATEGTQAILLQINPAAEASKGGVGSTQVLELADRVAEACPRLRIAGLMVMPPASVDANQTRPHFRTAREILSVLQAHLRDHPCTQLSMGTSQDFAVAIEEGATWVRIGTEIFGPRPSP